MKTTNKKKLTIAVTGLNAIDSPGPGIAVIRAIRDSRNFVPRIVGLAYEGLEPGIYMGGIVDKTYQIPYPSAGSDALLARLKYIHSKEKIDIVIPNFDAELHSFIKLSEKLNDLGIRSFLPSLQQLGAREKINLSAFCRTYGFTAPRDRIINKADDIKKAAEEFGLPLVVKGKFYDATVAYSIDQAQKAFYHLSAKWGLPVIIQEYVTGTEVNIAALGDGKGHAISVVPMKKLYITDKGKAWAGITLDDKKLVRLAERFIKATAWRGGCELEVILSSKNKKPYILEINPRFPAWIYLAVAAGQNQPAALVNMALGKTVKPWRRYAAGKIFIRYSWDLITDVDDFQKISVYGEK